MRITFWSALALVSLTEARRSRTEDLDVLGDEPEGFDPAQKPGRREKPSGFEATDDPVDEDRQFNRWSASFGANYKTVDEYKKRGDLWKAANTEIRENNEKAERSGDPDAAYMDHNLTSDMTNEELQKMLGAKGGKRLKKEHRGALGTEGRDLARKFKD